MAHGPARTTAGIGAAALLLMGAAMTAHAASPAPATPVSSATPLAPAAPVAAPAAPPAPATPLAPAAGPVDVATTLTSEPKAVAPGRQLTLTVASRVVSGQVSTLDVAIALPPGVTYAESLSWPPLCTPSPGGRTIACRQGSGTQRNFQEQIIVTVGKNVPSGTRLTFTATTDIGDAVDSKPEDNSATTTTELRTGNDLGVAWKAPSKPVEPGKDVPTELVVTNHGPGAVELFVVHLSVGWDYWPKNYDKACWADPGVLICDLYDGLAPGESYTLPFTWNFPKKAAGTTYRLSAGLYTPDILDPVTENDGDELVIRIAKPSKPSKPSKPTPPPTPTPTASVSATPTPPAPAPAGGSGGGELAESGADGSLAVTAGAAAALTVAGALALLVRPRARRPATSEVRRTRS